VQGLLQLEQTLHVQYNVKESNVDCVENRFDFRKFRVYLEKKDSHDDTRNKQCPFRKIRGVSKTVQEQRKQILPPKIAVFFRNCTAFAGRVEFRS
jgi:hypothetical protein